MFPQRRAKGICKAKRVIKIRKQMGMYEDHPEWAEKELHHLVSTRKNCSCHMCGNARRHYHEITMQERKQNLRYKEELEEVRYEEAS